MNIIKKLIPIISPIVTAFVFFYELIYLGIIKNDVVALVTSISLFMVFICKVIYVSRLGSSKRSKRKGYLYMGIIMFIISIVFSVAQVTKIRTNGNKDYTLLVGIVIILYVIINMIIAFIGLLDARRNKDYLKLGMKRISISCSLMNTIIIYRMILLFFEIELEYPYITIIVIAAIINILAIVTIYEAISLIIRYKRDKMFNFKKYLKEVHKEIEGESVNEWVFPKKLSPYSFS